MILFPFIIHLLSNKIPLADGSCPEHTHKYVNLDYSVSICYFYLNHTDIEFIRRHMMNDTTTNEKYMGQVKNVNEARRICNHHVKKLGDTADRHETDHKEEFKAWQSYANAMDTGAKAPAVKIELLKIPQTTLYQHIWANIIDKSGQGSIQMYSDVTPRNQKTMHHEKIAPENYHQEFKNFSGDCPYLVQKQEDPEKENGWYNMKCDDQFPDDKARDVVGNEQVIVCQFEEPADCERKDFWECELDEEKECRVVLSKYDIKSASALGVECRKFTKLTRNDPCVHGKLFHDPPEFDLEGGLDATSKCTQNCTWSQWSVWGNCSKCTKVTRERYHTQEKVGFGAECLGLYKETVWCGHYTKCRGRLSRQVEWWVLLMIMSVGGLAKIWDSWNLRAFTNMR